MVNKEQFINEIVINKTARHQQVSAVIEISGGIVFASIIPVLILLLFYPWYAAVPLGVLAGATGFALFWWAVNRQPPL